MKKTWLSVALIVVAIILVFGYCLIKKSIHTEDTQNNVKKVYEIVDYLVKSNPIEENFLFSRKGYKFFPYSWNTEKQIIQWKYINGIWMYALLKTGKYDSYVNDFYNNIIYSDGSIDYYERFSLDSVLPARTLFYIKDEYKLPKYRKAIDFVYSELQIQPVIKGMDGNFYHKVYSQKWTDYIFALDSTYICLPFLMEYAEKIASPTESKKIENLVFKQMQWIHENMRNKYGLYDHGVYKDGKTLNGIVWLRGMGWYAMAQVDIIELMSDSLKKEIMIKNVEQFFNEILKYCDEKTNMWRNVVIPNNINAGLNNRFETSGSLMLAYAMLKAYNNGYLTDKKYAEAGLRIFNSVVENKIIKIGSFFLVRDIYRNSNVRSTISEYCLPIYVNNEAKGLGPLLLAAIEASRTKL